MGSSSTRRARTGSRRAATDSTWSATDSSAQWTPRKKVRPSLPRSSGLDFGELFAFCDLHVSRWRLRRVANPLEYLSIPMYYDRQGFPLQAEHPDDLRNDEGWRMSVLTWAMKMQDPAYHRVAEDDFPDGTWLSTVWLGLDHSHGFGPPTIFETMYFSGRTETRLT